MVRIDIEVIIIASIIFLVLLWFIWLTLSRVYHNRRYKPENDKGRQAEEKRRRDGESTGRESIFTDSTISSPRPAEPKKQDVFPAASSSSNGETSKGNGKTREKSRKLFRRGRR